MRSHLVMARDEADDIFAANAKIEAPRDALDKLRASIASSPSARLHSVKASLIDKLGLFLSGLAPRQLAYAGISAALAIAVLGGSLGSFYRAGRAPVIKRLPVLVPRWPRVRSRLLHFSRPHLRERCRRSSLRTS